LPSWSQKSRRSRTTAALAAWFNRSRWSAQDAIAAIAALLLAIILFIPWYQAVVKMGTSSVTGILIDPPGTVTGIAAHHYLWAALALALLQCVILVLGNAAGRGAFRVPFYRQVLLGISAVTLIVVVTACFSKPAPWYGDTSTLGDGFYIEIQWAVGAFTAVVAVVVSLVVSIMAVQRQPRYQRLC
jgi:hypothetical protein